MRKFQMAQTAEEYLFTELKAYDNIKASTPIFILAAPRTGSTTFYKAMAHFFGLPFISNFTNDNFASTPIVGMAIQKSMATKISWSSSYGKTQGIFQPSEGSAVMGHWFGGGHPSQRVSNWIKKGAETHFMTSIKAIEQLYGKPVVIKNAWHCFRVKYLAKTFPNAQFVWLQRDVIETASSDLYARHVTKNDANSWNSATPANYKALLKRSPIEQVVENQYEFNKAILDDLEQYATDRWINIWFEDFLLDRESVLKSVSAQADLKIVRSFEALPVDASEKEALAEVEQNAIWDYVKSKDHHKRLQNIIYKGPRAW